MFNIEVGTPDTPTYVVPDDLPKDASYPRADNCIAFGEVIPFELRQQLAGLVCDQMNETADGFDDEQWHEFDLAARREGWIITNDSEDRVCIAKLDDPASCIDREGRPDLDFTEPKFESDDEAIAYVQLRAEAGSGRHRQAMFMHKSRRYASVRLQEIEATNLLRIRDGRSDMPKRKQVKMLVEELKRRHGFDEAEAVYKAGAPRSQLSDSLLDHLRYMYEEDPEYSTGDVEWLMDDVGMDSDDPQLRQQCLGALAWLVKAGLVNEYKDRRLSGKSEYQAIPAGTSVKWPVA